MSLVIFSGLAAQNGDYRPPTIDADMAEGQEVQSPSQQPEISQRRPATVVSLSPESSGTTSVSFSLPAAAAAQNGVAHLSEQDIEVRRLNAEIKSAEVRLKARDAFAKHFEAAQASYDMMANTAPKAAMALDGKEIAEVVKKALSLGYNPLGGKDNYIFGWEGKVYTFMADGSATVHEEGVATSVEQQQAALKASKVFLDRATDPMTDVTNERKALTAKRDALVGATVERIA
jgi:hypothetical protein